MAGASNSSKSTAKQFSHDIFFDGALLSDTRASLVVELIKYFLYERQQISLPVDELRDQVEHYENLKKDDAKDRNHGNNDDGHLSLSLKQHKQFMPDCEANIMQTKSQSFSMSKFSDHSDSALSDLTNSEALHTESKLPGLKGHAAKHFLDRRTKALVSDLAKLFNSLQKAFESCPEIEQVAVILGGTVMNPKESYLISFPPPSPEADSIPLLACKRTLFQQIISEDLLGTMSSKIMPTNMMLLVSAPRSCPLKGFLPKQSLRSPRNGSIISFNLHCNYVLPVCYDLTVGDGDFELSGLEQLDIHLKDRTVLVEKNLSAEACDSDKPKDESVCQSDEDKTHFVKKEFDEREQICDYPSHIQLELSHLKLSGEEHFHVRTPGIGLVDRRLTLKPHLVSSTPILPNSSLMEISETDQIKSDCIWYQSPIVIKGYRNVERFPNQSAHSRF